MADNIHKKVDRIDRAARLERLQSPEMIQKTKAIRFPLGVQERRAEVIGGLKYPDPENEDPDLRMGIDHYICRLFDSEYTEWESGPTISYICGDLHLYNNKLYRCLLDHGPPVSVAENPEATEGTLWESQEEVNPIPLAREGDSTDYKGDLRNFLPWFEVGDIVPLVEREGVWYFNLQMFQSGDEENSSLRWGEKARRVMAVYK